MKCKHNNKLNSANFCKTTCYYCTGRQEEECKIKHPEYFEAYGKSVETIRKHIIEAFWNKPILGEHYINWHTEDGYCGVTLIFKSTNEVFDIVIKKR